MLSAADVPESEGVVHQLRRWILFWRAVFLSALSSFLVLLALLGCGGGGATQSGNVQPHGFTPTGSMKTARSGHTTTRLNDGMVLIAGGRSDSSGVLSSAELYNPATQTFTITGSMNVAREWHTATLLHDGTVLIANGTDQIGGLVPGAEVYDPATQTFTITGSMNVARKGNTATLLNDGTVLIAGGQDVRGPLSSAELYDSATGTFTITGSLNFVCSGPNATLLNNGVVLLAGGYSFRDPLQPETIFCLDELYNPATRTFTPTGSMNTARSGHTATRLYDGTVLIAGGTDQICGLVPGAEVYDPATQTFTITGNLNTGRFGHTASLLSNGTVLIAGGSTGPAPYFTSASAELYDPATQTFTNTGSMNVARDRHTATLLHDGTVLIAGGVGSGITLSSAELFR